MVHIIMAFHSLFSNTRIFENICEPLNWSFRKLFESGSHFFPVNHWKLQKSGLNHSKLISYDFRVVWPSWQSDCSWRRVQRIPEKQKKFQKPISSVYSTSRWTRVIVTTMRAVSSLLTDRTCRQSEDESREWPRRLFRVIEPSKEAISWVSANWWPSIVIMEDSWLWLLKLKWTFDRFKKSKIRRSFIVDSMSNMSLFYFQGIRNKKLFLKVHKRAYFFSRPSNKYFFFLLQNKHGIFDCL